MKRCITALLTCAALTFSAAQVASAASFPDVGEKNWCYSYVTDLADKGIVTGLPDGNYGPEQPVTRGSVAKLLWESLKYKAVALSTDSQVTLVTGAWSAQYINELASAGILLASEYPNGAFVENAAMSRLETIKAIVRAYLVANPTAKLPTASLTFTDASSIPAADQPLVAMGVDLGIINGITVDGGTKFAPNDPIQRSTVAAMISRFLTVVGETIKQSGSAQTDVPDYVPIEAPVIKTTTGETVEWVVSPTVDASLSYPFYDGYSRVLFGELSAPTGYGYINEVGELMGIYPEAEDFRNGFAVVYTTAKGAGGVRMGGVINTDFNWVFGPVECCFIDILSVGYISVNHKVGTLDEHNTYYSFDGKEISEDEVAAAVQEDYAAEKSVKETVESKGKSVLYTGYGDGSGLISFATNDPAALAAINKNPVNGIPLDRCYGFADKNGKVVIPPTYDGASEYKNGYGEASLRIAMDIWKSDVFDASGTLVYTYYRSQGLKEGEGYQLNQFGDYAEGLVTTTTGYNHKCGYMTPTGELIIPKVFDDVSPFSNGLATVVYNGKVGIIKNPL